MPDVLEMTRRKSAFISEKLSVQLERKRGDTLSQLHDEPTSSPLRAYFGELEEGSSTWDITVFIEAAKRFANLVGPDRARYYDNILKGIHYPNTFTELWNQKYPELPITVWDRDIRHQCPPGWSNELKDSHLTLTYRGEAPLSHGLNELVRGPTTLDCGMFCQLLLWMATRGLLGDELFNKLFNFEPGKFVITERWDLPLNEKGSVGNLLFPFYDGPLQGQTAHSLGSQSRIQTSTVFNDPRYLFKHPGGEGRLQNVMRIDGAIIVFEPGTQNTLSGAQLDKRLLQEYNAPRNWADEETLWIWTVLPDHVHPDFGGRSFATLAEGAAKFGDHALNEVDWVKSKDKREKCALGLQFMFNYQRLVTCVKDAEYAQFEGPKYEYVFSRARELQEKAARER